MDYIVIIEAVCDAYIDMLNDKIHHPDTSREEKDRLADEIYSIRAALSEAFN